MRQIILDIPENKFQFFMELVKNLGFVKTTELLSLIGKKKLLGSVWLILIITLKGYSIGMMWKTILNSINGF